MRASLSLLLIAFVLCTSVSAQFVTRFIIDDFGVGQGDSVLITLSAEVEEYGPDVQEVQSFNYPSTCVNLVGCARDMELRVIKGLNGRSFSSQILSPDDVRFAGNWVVANPKTSIGFVSLEYDGPDSEFDDLVNPEFSLSLNGSGSAGVDITDGGLGRELRFIVITDLLTTFTVTMYDTAGGECTYSVQITPVDNDYTDAETLYSIDLNSASPNSCNRQSIGYIQLFVTNNDAVDLIVRRIEIIGDPDPSPSATPSRTRTPSPAASASNTRSPLPSASRTPSSSPSRTPSPSGPCIVFCTCPSFTCQIAYDADDNVNTVEDGFTSRFFFDDDDSGVVIYVDDDANPDDDQIIYITRTVIQSAISDFTSDLSVSFTQSFTNTFTASFSSGDDDDDSSNSSDDDDNNSSNNDDDDDDSSNSSSSNNDDDDDSSNSSDDDDDNNGSSSSSSSASVIAASVALIAVALF